ncbi:unnamed protein product [Lathyrus oleraceus]|uniref:non-specific lipid-transfer protein 2-like n=1 Tax=Pisum sativum TaxID=3888 RepID=UPI001FC5748C|nr:non-specific lipid-transfer protein 2-like [Pisum sativum]
MARSMKLACVVLVICMVVIAPMAEAALSCGAVTGDLAPCVTYLQAPNNASPPPPCCAGVKKLLGAATTTPDRQAACNCLKSAAGSISKLNTNNVAALPGNCGVSIPYKISTSTNCNTYVLLLLCFCHGSH